MNKICGFIILRKPEYNFDSRPLSAFSIKPPSINNIYYSGLDRMPWFDIDEGYYNKTLADKILKLRTKLHS